jgi:hypothetical protein
LCINLEKTVPAINEGVIIITHYGSNLQHKGILYNRHFIVRLGGGFKHFYGKSGIVCCHELWYIPSAFMEEQRGLWQWRVL